MARFYTEQATRRAGLVDGRYKVLRDRETGRSELFDLARDPEERASLAAQDPERLALYAPCLQ